MNVDQSGLGNWDQWCKMPNYGHLIGSRVQGASAEASVISVEQKGRLIIVFFALFQAAFRIGNIFKNNVLRRSELFMG